MKPSLTLLPFLLLSTNIFASSSEPESFASVCSKWQSAEISKKANAERSKAVAPSDCDYEALYFGTSSGVSYEKAKSCALTKVNDDEGGVFSASLALAFLYLNGRGGTKDIDLARYWACQHGDLHAPAETIAWLAALHSPPSKNLELCDLTTSGYMMTFCAQIKSDIAQRPLLEKWSKAVSSLADPEKKLANSARAKFLRFVETRLDIHRGEMVKIPPSVANFRKVRLISD